MVESAPEARATEKKREEPINAEEVLELGIQLR